jgi:6-phosphogluconolactonase
MAKGTTKQKLETPHTLLSKKWSDERKEAMSKRLSSIILAATLMLLSATVVFAKSPWANDVVGAVYAMTNSSVDNEVVFFDRDSGGVLTNARAISTQGIGSGSELDPLGSQGSLVLTDDGRWLFAVNAGSNEISVFRVLSNGLNLTDKIDSGGVFPVSVAVFHDLVYILNAGMSPNITGFSLSPAGQLFPLVGSARSLGDGGFAQVAFSPAGTWLAVTDKVNNRILIYGVGRDGLPEMKPAVSASSGTVPFGLVFDQRGHLLVVEAGANAVSSYTILPDGTLQVISPSVANGQNASCWIAGNNRGDIFTANTGSQTISAYALAAGSGEISLLDEAAGLGNRPIDMSVTSDGRFLYALDPANGGVDMFRINPDGSLTGLGVADGGLAIFAQGIAAR